MKPIMDKRKQKACRNLFGVADAAYVEAQCKEVMKLQKQRFVKRWGFDPEKLNKLTKIEKNICCSATSIDEMKEGDFVVVSYTSWFCKFN